MTEEMEVVESTANGEAEEEKDVVSNIPNLALAKKRVLQDPNYARELAEHLKLVGADKKEETLKKLDDKIQDAVENQGESEVRQAWFEKAEFLANVGDFKESMAAFQTTLEKTVGVGNQLDVVFQMFRIGLYQMDHRLMKEKLDKAKELMEKGGDWERKNRLKAYEGLYALSTRDFAKAANLFLDCVSTFTSYELMSYKELVFYTVVSAILTL
jgi:26S proteasome regulatory subunit N7